MPGSVMRRFVGLQIEQQHLSLPATSYWLPPIWKTKFVGQLINGPDL